MHNRLPTTSFMYTRIYVCSVTPWTTAHQAPLSMGFSRQVYWTGLPFPPPRSPPEPGIEPKSPVSPVLAGGFLTTTSPEKPCIHVYKFLGNKDTWMWMLLVNTNRDEKKSNLLFTVFVQMRKCYFYNKITIGNFAKLIYIYIFFTLQYCTGFATHQHDWLFFFLTWLTFKSHFLFR